MATQTVEFRSPPSQTITAKLFAVGSDIEVASVSATEATNRKGTYAAAYTDVAAGEYELIALVGAVPVARWFVTLTLTTATFQVYDKAQTVMIVDNTITAASIATDAVIEIQSGLSTHSAADVWAVGARTLTAFGFTVTTTNAADVTAILADTSELQTDWVDGGRLDLILDARASQTSVNDLPTNAQLATALGTADDATLAAIAAEAIKTTAIQAKTDLIPSDPADQSAVEAAITAATSGLASQTSVDDVPTVAEFEARTIVAANYATAANLLIVSDGVGFITAVLMGACSDAGTAGETYVITFGGSTYTADYTGLDATGNRTTTTRTKT